MNRRGMQNRRALDWVNQLFSVKMWLCEPGHGAQTVIMNQAGYPKWDVSYVDRSAQLYMATQSVR